MNRRTLKKRCRRAMTALVDGHHFPRRAFVSATGEETLDAPAAIERRFVHHGFMSALKGTPLLLVRTSYECDAWSHRLPIDALAEIELVQKDGQHG